ncbi:MAG: RNA-binding protein [Fimbriimonadales bacterium]|nr:RNA-binding protein [Fimbriimonadales bacterium]
MAIKTLYIGNLSYSTTESGLLEAFSAFGAQSARIVEGRGFGFVDVEASQMEDAIAQKDQTQLDGRTINVSEARPKASGGGGGNRGGYGGGGYSSDRRGGGGGRSGGRRGW